MADIRIKDLTTTAAASSADDYIAVDGTSSGTRKLSAATPSFATSVTVPGVVGPTSTDLTLTGGSTGASLVLGATASGIATITTGTPTTGRLNVGAANIFVTGGSAGLWLNASGAFDVGAYEASGALRFRTGTADKMSLTSTGNLLIGTTTDAASLAGGLVVNGSGAGAAASSTTTGALRVTGGVGVSGAGYFGGNVNAGGALVVGNTYANSAKAFIFGTLKVGGDAGQATGTIVLGDDQSSGTNVGLYRGQSSMVVGGGNWLNLAGYDGVNITAGAATFGSQTKALSITSTAATFSGAVTIAGTVIHTLSATPASASATGTVGTMSWDANYIYICTATNTWKRVAIATW